MNSSFHFYFKNVIRLILYFFIFFSIILYDKILNIIPCAVEQVLVIYLFTYSCVYLLIPDFRFILPLFPFSNHFFSYVNTGDFQGNATILCLGIYDTKREP